MNFLNKKQVEYWYPLITGMLKGEICKYLTRNGFWNIDIPVLNESVANKPINFKLDCYGMQTELSSSNALKLGVASVIYNKVFCCSHVFRNEIIEDNLHLVEFSIVEAEWIEKDYRKLINEIILIFKYGIKSYNEFIEKNQLRSILPAAPNDIKIDVITYEKMLMTIRKVDNDLAPEEHGVMYDNRFSELIKRPTIICFYPPSASWRAKTINKKKALIFNFILPNGYGELFEFSIRETDFNKIKGKFLSAGVLNSYSWYLKGLQHNSANAAGFGLGIERFANWLVQSQNIKKMQLFPRTQRYFRREKNE